MDLTNRGDVAAMDLSVEGEWLGRTDRALMADVLPPLATRSVTLRFPLDVARPGVHALALSLRYLPKGRSAPAGGWSQRAYLLLNLGAAPPPAVRLTVPQISLDTMAVLPVKVESADGWPHGVRLRLLAPRGLNVDPDRSELAVPAVGSAALSVQVWRAGVLRGVSAGLVVLAETTDGPQATAAATSTTVQVQPDPARLPRLRRDLSASGLGLLAAALLLEVRRRWLAEPRP